MARSLPFSFPNGGKKITSLEDDGDENEQRDKESSINEDRFVDLGLGSDITVLYR